ncbi:hypothetical protein B296_00036134, partial [Ensete ventricosum]
DGEEATTDREEGGEVADCVQRRGCVGGWEIAMAAYGGKVKEEEEEEVHCCHAALPFINRCYCLHPRRPPLCSLLGHSLRHHPSPPHRLLLWPSAPTVGHHLPFSSSAASAVASLALSRNHRWAPHADATASSLSSSRPSLCRRC